MARQPALHEPLVQIFEFCPGAVDLASYVLP